MSPALPLPLVAGTEIYFDPHYLPLHLDPVIEPAFDLACYIIKNATIGGAGNVWIDDHLIVSPEIMPVYVQDVLGLKSGGSADLHRTIGLPTRTIHSPCLVACGHGIQVYGHFLIEMLFRILVSQRAYEFGPRIYKILLDKSCPNWLLKILVEDLRIDPDDFLFFDPHSERILLSHAIIPTLPYRNERYHDNASVLLEDFVDRLKPIEDIKLPSRIFALRRNFQNPSSLRRVCLNEERLAAIAQDHYGFSSIVPEDLHWRQQILLFQNADYLLGQCGSALHTALFSQAGTHVGSIGFLNFTQSGIGALRRQRNAYFTKGINLNGDFSVNEEDFFRFMAFFCK